LEGFLLDVFSELARENASNKKPNSLKANYRFFGLDDSHLGAMRFFGQCVPNVFLLRNLISELARENTSNKKPNSLKANYRFFGLDDSHL
jgi:hypothetical protein